MKKLFLVLLLAFNQLAVANPGVSVKSTFKSGNELKTVTGDTISIPQEGPAHLVFIDIWASYGGHGPEAALQALPESFHKTVPTIWFQPRMNVTDRHLLDYQQAFPHSKPLVMDEYFQVMRRYGVHETPVHVLLEDGKAVFAGGTEAFLAHIGHEAVAQKATQEQQADEDHSAATTEAENHKVPSVKNIDNLKEFLYASGDRVQLIFLDDLCPTDHMPGCEKTVEQISQSYRPSDHNWIVIYNNFYSDQLTSQAFSEKHKLTMPALFDEDHAVFDRYKVYSTPYFIELNRSGEVISRGSKVSILTESAQKHK